MMQHPAPHQTQDDVADVASARQHWDTSQVASRERFDYFHDGVCRAFFAFSPERPSGRDFEARIDKMDVPLGSILKIDVTPHRVVRTAADRASIPFDYLSLNLHTGGQIVEEIQAVSHQFNRGDLSLVHGNHIDRFSLNGSNYQTLSLILDKSLVDEVGGLTRLKVASLPKAFGWTPLRLCVKLMSERHESAAVAEMAHLFEACVSLLKASFVSDREFLGDRLEAHPAAQQGMSRLIRRAIQLEVSDANLSLATISERFGISPRYVQKLFSKDGTTFRAYVVGLRLENVRNEFVDPHKAHVSLSDIAQRWGFRDMTTFHRNFKDYFGDTPGSMRENLLR